MLFRNLEFGSLELGVEMKSHTKPPIETVEQINCWKHMKEPSRQNRSFYTAQ
jgi:hypothetical protein